MKIYLLRHGVSQDREDGKRQAPDSPLSSQGIKQAKTVAGRLKSESIDKILTSDVNRARQTAEVIARRLKLPLEILSSLRESEVLPEIYGIKIGGELDIQYRQEMNTNLYNISWKFRNQGESALDTALRAQSAIRHLLDKHLGQSLLLVSHGKFLRALVNCCLLGPDFDPKSFMQLYIAFTFDNTSLSLLEFDEEKQIWKLRFLNEHHHLKRIANK